MCTRMIPLTYDEAAAVLESREHAGRAHVARRDEFDPVYDAYPGSRVPAYVMDSHGRLVTVKLAWGFTFGGQAGAVFNTRIETALDQLRCARRCSIRDLVWSPGQTRSSRWASPPLKQRRSTGWQLSSSPRV